MIEVTEIKKEITRTERKQATVESLRTAELALRQSFDGLWWAIEQAHQAGNQLLASVLDARLSEMKRTAQMIGTSVLDIEGHIKVP